ncbi:MAG: hypothetical protein ACYC61_33485, partial [Isosphaeraceae bacterium]
FQHCCGQARIEGWLLAVWLPGILVWVLLVKATLLTRENFEKNQKNLKQKAELSYAVFLAFFLRGGVQDLRT